VKFTQKKCDSLLTPIIKKLFPHCLLCGGQTEVAHHHCHKSKSLTLRYDFENLIPLCGKCHMKLHWNESYWASIIVKIKGLKWVAYLEKKKQKTLRYPNYEKIYNELLKQL
jgi:hypothetical protein